MHRRILGTFAAAGLCLVANSSVLAQRGQPQAQADPNGPFTVTVVAPTNGTVKVTPALPPDGHVAKGTVITLTAAPAAGYALDSTWYSVPGRFGQMYHEAATREFKITVDQNTRVGASFIDEAAVKDLVVTNDVVFAKPGKKTLKYDVYARRGARNLPIIVIVHGGGWTANDEDIMRGLARELTKGNRFVVASLDYRWAGTADGDAPGNTMASLIEDVFGGIAHIMEHATKYGGDATRIGVTGDSAGGHLSAAVSLMPDMIGSRGFGRTPGVFEFMPSYLPAGKTVDEVRSEMLKAIKAAAPSYGVFSAANLNVYSEANANDQAWKQAIAPLSHIPDAKARAVPQFLTRGTRDTLISNAMVTEFTDALVTAGQRVEYIQVGGAGHAFFDWKPDETTKATFARYGVYYAAAMRGFFESTLY